MKKIIVDGAQLVTQSARKAIDGPAGVYNATEILGYRVAVPGTGVWGFTFVNGGTVSVPAAAMIAGNVHYEHLASIIVGTGGQAVLYIPAE